METIANARRKIQQNLRGIRDNEVRRKAALLIMVLEAKNISEGCRRAGLVRNTFYDWMKKLRASEFNLLELNNQSRRPHQSPRKTPPAVEQAVLKLNEEKGNSDRLLAHQLHQLREIELSHSTVCNILKRNGKAGTYKTKKPNSFNRRYSASKPLERVQSDTLWTGLEDDNGNRVYMVAFIDDHSRLTFGELHDAKGGFEATKTLKNFIRLYGMPQLVQTDNGTEFTNHFVSFLHPNRAKGAKLAAFEQVLKEHGITHHLIRPRTPQHNGKIERFNQTVLREFAARVPNNLPLSDYQRRFAIYLDWYNKQRMHSSLKYLTPHKTFYQSEAS